MTSEREKGYNEQRSWLAGKTLDEARTALDARLATLASNPYNEGGNQATRDQFPQLITSAADPLPFKGAAHGSRPGPAQSAT